MDRGAWQATVHAVTELDMTEHTHTIYFNNNSSFTEHLLWPRLELNTSRTCNPWTTRQGKHGYFHFTDEETEVQWSPVIYPRSLS